MGKEEWMFRNEGLMMIIVEQTNAHSCTHSIRLDILNLGNG